MRSAAPVCSAGLGGPGCSTCAPTIRAAATDVHHTVDDSPVRRRGGDVDAPGTDLRQPSRRSIRRARCSCSVPAGAASTRQLAHELAATDGFSLLCGRYEGVDHRIRAHLVDDELSVGDVVLAGGEVAACLVIEAVTRLVPGVMGNDVSPVTESFGERGLLEEPQFTRPASFHGWDVPDVLRSGDHGRIERWRRAQALHRTIVGRPDLIAARGGLSCRGERLLEFPPLPFLDRPPPDGVPPTRSRDAAMKATDLIDNEAASRRHAGLAPVTR